jgi:DNA primase
MYGELVGYVGRHTWSKKKITRHNNKAKINGTYQVLRYRNSEGNEFAKMLGGFDKIVEGETDTAILVEGFMDVVNISQQMDLFASNDVRAVCTFGKKISEEQIFHLQEKGVRNVIIFYDTDAVEDVKRMDLDKYFNVLVCFADDATGYKSGMDAGDLSAEQIEECLSNAKKTNEMFYDRVVIYEL